MVQLFQRYVPYSSILDFLVQSLLCLTAFTLSVQLAFHFHLVPMLPALIGVRAGRTLTTVSVRVTVFYLTGYFERRNHLTLSRFVPRLLNAVPHAAVTLFAMYAFVPAIALPWEVASAGLAVMTVLMVGWHLLAPPGTDHCAARVLRRTDRYHRRRRPRPTDRCLHRESAPLGLQASELHPGRR